MCWPHTPGKGAIHWNVANLPMATSLKKTYSFPQQPTTVNSSLAIMELVSSFPLPAGMLNGLIMFKQGQPVDMSSWVQRSCHVQKLLFTSVFPTSDLQSFHSLFLDFPGDLGWGSIAQMLHGWLSAPLTHILFSDQLKVSLLSTVPSTKNSQMKSESWANLGIEILIYRADW